jgi:uncharacterized protein YciW
VTKEPVLDIIETLVSAKPGSALADAMEKRAEILRLSQAAHDAVLLPRDPGGLPHGLRASLAARMARHNGNEALADHYVSLVDRAGEPDMALLASPGTNVANLRTAAIVRHADMLTVAPREARRADIEALRESGVNDADIVRLSELAAFVNYQVRVIAGMNLIGGRK